MLDNPKLIEKLIRAIPLRRAADPVDQARVIAFFASEAAGGYCTGQILSVSGGTDHGRAQRRHRHGDPARGREGTR